MREFLRGTLLYVQQERLCLDSSLWEVVQRSVQLLKDGGLITVAESSQGNSLQVTKLGKATYKGLYLSNVGRIQTEEHPSSMNCSGHRKTNTQ